MQFSIATGFIIASKRNLKGDWKYFPLSPRSSARRIYLSFTSTLEFNLLLSISAFNATHPDIDGESQSGEGNIQIQIEVDIQPPEDGEHLSDDQLASLGLPSKHIHYTAGSGAAAAAGATQEHTAELLQPADIQVSYADTEQDVGPGLTRDTVIRDTWMPRDTQTQDGYVSVPELEYEEVDPPRALPDTSADIPLADNIYNVDAYCGLECGGGECRITETGAKRCVCPPGWGGAGCGDVVTTAGAPRLSGLSHLTLPTLQNAYSDLHMALDFKPETNTGVILITGQTEDMTGDYLALILSDGYVELRCAGCHNFVKLISLKVFIIPRRSQFSLGTFSI